VQMPHRLGQDWARIGLGPANNRRELVGAICLHGFMNGSAEEDMNLSFDATEVR